MTHVLTIADILAIHHDLIDRYGGTHGLRDPGRLEAALFRPQTGYYPDPVAEAAALWESLVKNHAFVDGNKRIGFAGMYTFPVINGFRLTADADTAWAFVSGLYETGDFRFRRLASWLRAHTCRDGPEPGI